MEALTPRFKFPLLFVSQAQKEITHNEALSAIDHLLHPTIVAQLSTPPSPLPADAGKCWLVAATPTGAWSNSQGKLACWTGDGWRYHSPSEGMSVWDQQMSLRLLFRSGNWYTSAIIADPAGGSTVDAEARSTIASLLQELKNLGIIDS